MRSKRAGASLAPLSRRASALYSVSTRSVDLPPPETPVTQVNSPSGMSAEIFFRLLPRAPTTRSTRCGFFGRRSGTAISRTPLRYSPVSDAGLAMISAGVPWATMLPPCTPAPGPTSTT